MPEDAPRPEMIALAKAIHRRMRDWEEAHGQPFKKDTNLSRLLENDPDYEPYRPRNPNKKRSAAKEPSLFTIKHVAEQLDTTVGDLLGEREFDVTIGDRRRIRDLLEFLRQRLALDSIEDVAPQPLEYRFPVSPALFKERDYDYPQALHAWVVPEIPMAAGPSGMEAERPLLTTEVLHSIRDVRTRALQVVRVIGDSMADLLLDGYKVLVDTRLKKPQRGDLVAVYIKAEGGVIGFWREEARGEIFLVNATSTTSRSGSATTRSGSSSARSRKSSRRRFHGFGHDRPSRQQNAGWNYRPPKLIRMVAMISKVSETTPMARAQVTARSTDGDGLSLISRVESRSATCAGQRFARWHHPGCRRDRGRSLSARTGSGRIATRACGPARRTESQR